MRKHFWFYGRLCKTANRVSKVKGDYVMDDIFIFPLRAKIEHFLDMTGMTKKEFAEGIGMSTASLCAFLKGKGGISTRFEETIALFYR